MKSIKLLPLAAISLFLIASPVWAQDEEVTIDVVSDSESEPGEITSEIRLPDTASDEARENAAFGLDTANSAREKRREFGEERASEAREQRGIGEDASGSGNPGVRPGKP